MLATRYRDLDKVTHVGMRQFNVVLLGAGGVGKSALTVRFVKDQFLDHYDPTIEEEYRRTITVDNELTSLEVLDTAGAEQFTSLNEVYIKAGRGFILVFSLTQEASLKEVENIRQQIYQIKGGGTNVPIVVVGTKLDLQSEREVQHATIQSLASRWNLPFYETSAKRNWHVNDVFEDIVRQMRERYPPENVNRKKKKGPCIIM
ncbi:rap 1A [Pleurotus eryngii]|uniref:Rap 1A n=4 Tax=Pleurotus TaxID=5320 RepID=A0A9P5ZSY4_PLEER|nr:rap 1A [Pleurotus eryngii]